MGRAPRVHRTRHGHGPGASFGHRLEPDVPRGLEGRTDGGSTAAIERYDRMRCRIVDEPERVPAQPARVASHDRERGVGRDRRVDGRAAGPQDVDADAGGEVMWAGHRAIRTPGDGHRHRRCDSFRHGRKGRASAHAIPRPRCPLFAGYPAPVFATLIGPYPPIDGTAEERLRAAISDQLDAGLGMLSDGRLHHVASPGAVETAVAAWRSADRVGHHLAAELGLEPPLIKACLVGPWTAGSGEPHRVRVAAEHMRGAIDALFEAGAPVVQVTEAGIGDIEPGDEDAMALVDAVLAELTDGIEGHLSLALAGGRPTRIPAERLFAAPFASYLFDLIHSPDDWSLCARAPTPAGLIVGVADARNPDPDTAAVTIWGARYAASLGGRGASRVGLTTSAGLERLAREAARGKLMALAEAGRQADLPDAELLQVLDPRAIDARSAALGRYEPPSGRP